MNKIKQYDETKGQLIYALCFIAADVLIIGSFLLIEIFKK